jgi:hypothetical protein
VQTGRKAVAAARESAVKAIAAEFNVQRDFRDRTSALESVLAAVQRQPQMRVIVFYHREESEQLEQLRARFPFIHPLAYPIEGSSLEALLSVS